MVSCAFVKKCFFEEILLLHTLCITSTLLVIDYILSKEAESSEGYSLSFQTGGFDSQGLSPSLLGDIDLGSLFPES